MPKRVDHQQRRRELADAVWRVVAREGLDGTSLQLVADQAGWSIGSLRHYFASKAELLPVDTARREEAVVWLAFIARATTDPTLGPVAEDVWRQLHDPLVARITEAIRGGELPAHTDAEREATRLQALIDGLAVHMVSAPRHAPPELAL